MRAKTIIFKGFTGRRAMQGIAPACAATALLLAATGAANAQAVPPAPLVNGQTVQGYLGDANDTLLPDGRPVDRFVINAVAPNQAYSIEAQSPAIPVASTVSLLEPVQGLVGIQNATVFSAGQKVLYAGALPQSGRYLVNIYSADLQQPVGAYTLSLCRDNDDDDDDDDLDDLDDCLDDDVLDDDGIAGGVPGGPVVGGPVSGGLIGDDDDDDGFDDDDFDD
ncbi:MAG: hypothetical protein H0V62_11955 [Gammaproteobacteria bacterium]|nr:hypothetical protein [Gammaproteobacteria bacterium]MBA3732200.1 hypothetical protein [Gammaproteobacteria bacterium]